MVVYCWNPQTNTYVPAQPVAAGPPVLTPAVLTTYTPAVATPMVVQPVIFNPYLYYFQYTFVNFYQPVPQARPFAPQPSARPATISPVQNVKFQVIFYGRQGPTFWQRVFELAYPLPPKRDDILASLTDMAQKTVGLKKVNPGQAKIWVLKRGSKGVQILKDIGPKIPEDLLNTIELKDAPPKEEFLMEMAEIRDSYLRATILVNCDVGGSFEGLNQRCADAPDPKTPTGDDSNSGKAHQDGGSRNNSNNHNGTSGGNRAPSPGDPEGGSSSERGSSPATMPQTPQGSDIATTQSPGKSPDELPSSSSPKLVDRKGKSCVRNCPLLFNTLPENHGEGRGNRQQGDFRHSLGAKSAFGVN
ncbi:Fc.00g030920.m01.CDS01 [Cosmosporella sp. VM-42]